MRVRTLTGNGGLYFIVDVNVYDLVNIVRHRVAYLRI